VAALFLGAAAVHVLLAATGGSVYRPFADEALFSFVRTGWREVFMSHPSGWALMVATGEATLGFCLLHGGRPAKFAYVGVIGFHLALMMFGWGFWIWSVPALVFLCWLAWADWPQLTTSDRVDAESLR
jgi:hypothetical protein